MGERDLLSKYIINSVVNTLGVRSELVVPSGGIIPYIKQYTSAILVH